MYRIYIIEDDAVIAAGMERHLVSWGHTVACAEDFRDILPALVRFDPQLILIDIALPFFNGFHWCAEIRRSSRVPIVFLSSASDDMNIVMAMNMGADDFIAKPFDLNVLSAKIAALLRRTYDFAGHTALIEHRGAILDLAQGSLRVRGDRIELTKNELRILQVLLENKGRVVSRSALIERLWETDSYIDDNTLTVNVARLRRKLEEAGLTGWIATKKGSGYLAEA